MCYLSTASCIVHVIIDLLYVADVFLNPSMPSYTPHTTTGRASDTTQSLLQNMEGRFSRNGLSTSVSRRRVHDTSSL